MLGKVLCVKTNNCQIKLLLIDCNTWSHLTMCKQIMLYRIINVKSQYWKLFNCVCCIATYATIHGNIVNTITTSGHSSSEKYTSPFIRKGCVWEGVGDWTELQHIDPHSSGYHSLSFPFSCATQPGAWGPSLSGTWFSFQRLLSNWPELPVSGVI